MIVFINNLFWLLSVGLVYESWIFKIYILFSWIGWFRVIIYVNSEDKSVKEVIKCVCILINL